MVNLEILDPDNILKKVVLWQKYSKFSENKECRVSLKGIFLFTVFLDKQF